MGLACLALCGTGVVRRRISVRPTVVGLTELDCYGGVGIIKDRRFFLER